MALLAMGSFNVFAAQPAELQPVLAKLAAAKAGETVNLPAGTFQIDQITLPSGVILTGAGYDKTILLTKDTYGLMISGATGTRVADLSVRGAKGAGIQVEKSSDITLSRVGIEQSLTGLMVLNSTKVRAENLILAENRTGAVFNGNSDSSFVNSTFEDNTAVSLSIGVNKNSAIFNNLFLNSSLGVFVAPENDSLLLDYNIYQVSKVGKSADTPPDSVYVWRDQTGYDVHSMQQAIEFSPGGEYIYKPSNVMAWSPDRVITSGWGTATLGAFAAPKLDIDGKPYTTYGPCIGAWDVALTATRPADGKLTVTGDEGTTSAGIYTKDGRLLTWLFNLLPLKKGTYSFWVPSRDLYGQPIVAGDYEIRTAQANLRFVPVGNGIAGNTGPGPTMDKLAQIANAQAIYDENGQVLIGLGWSEGGINLRSMAPDFKNQNWSLPGTSEHYGIAADGQGSVYSLRIADPNFVLLKIDQKSGHTQEILPGTYNHLVPLSLFSKLTGGIAILGDNLYLADTGGNKLFLTPLAKLDFAKSIDLPSPSSPCADTKRGWVWLLSGENIVAVDAAGTKKLEIPSPVAHANSLAVRGDILALLTEETGNVQLFDLTADPTKPVAKGQIAADAKAPAKIASGGPDKVKGQMSRLALNDGGDILVRFPNGLKIFGSDGAMKSDLLGGWYINIRLGALQPDGTITVYDSTQGDRRVVLDLKNKTWKLNGSFGNEGTIISTFERDGKSYLLLGGNTEPPAPGVHGESVFAIVRADGDKLVPLFAWTAATSNGAISTTQDFSKPFYGAFDPARWTPLLHADGTPIIGTSSPVFNTKGDVVFDNGFKITSWQLTGFDANGVPQYNYEGPALTMTIDGPNGAPFQSPYTFAPATPNSPGFVMPMLKITSYYSDGGIPRIASVAGGRKHSLIGVWGGSDLASFDKAGKLEWFQPLPEINGACGPFVVNDIIYTDGVMTSETQVFARDGLYLGRIGQPKGIPWGGKWLDNGYQLHPFAGPDGKQYMLYGDFNECCMFWFEVAGLDQVIYQKQSLVISPALATALAALPLPTVPKQSLPPTTKFTIKKLAAPLPIDGDMEKWRTILPVPQVIVTPDTGTPAISGPADHSSLVRFAYEGTNLYVQVITFDDVVTHFQDATLFYKQDGVEMAINSYLNGFKFGITHTRDKGDIFIRERFGTPTLTKYFDPDFAPRKITVLDNAESVPERKLIEALYNIDLSKSKVIVTEFKLPLDAGGYEGAEKDLPTTKSGDTMRIGLMIDDNDVPGGDVQDYELFPATYGTFNGPETGALATFE